MDRIIVGGGDEKSNAIGACDVVALNGVIVGVHDLKRPLPCIDGIIVDEISMGLGEDASTSFVE
jgi:hypothetical protein